MSHAGFELRPVRRYEAPRYPTTCLEAEEAAPEGRLRPRDVLRWLVCALLIAGLALGALACGDRARLAVVPPRADGGVTPDGGLPPGDGGRPPPDGGDDGGDILMGDVAECTPGDLYCADATTLMTCDTYSWVAVDCDAYCAVTYGSQSSSMGCSEAAAEPCQCYDMLDGGIAMCTPDMVECIDASTVSTCDPATGNWITDDCGDYCRELFGSDATATGCDPSTPANACGCVVP